MQTCKIATWNLCLGLSNKKDMVKVAMQNEKILICCMQEIDIDKDYPTHLLTFQGFNLELEENDLKARVGIYLSTSIKYKRRNDLEGKNSNLITINTF